MPLLSGKIDTLSCLLDSLTLGSTVNRWEGCLFWALRLFPVFTTLLLYLSLYLVFTTAISIGEADITLTRHQIIGQVFGCELVNCWEKLSFWTLWSYSVFSTLLLYLSLSLVFTTAISIGEADITLTRHQILRHVFKCEFADTCSCISCLSCPVFGVFVGCLFCCGLLLHV